jgi:Domain of unknown function (DUF4598)
MTQKRGREDGRAELLVSSLPKRPKASSSLAETRAISGSTVSEVDEAILDDDDDDYTSSSGTSSDDDDDDDDDENEDMGEKYDNAREEEIIQNQNTQNTQDRPQKSEDESITYVPGRPKPRIQRIQQPDDESGLMSRLSSFLPQLQAANADLEKKLADGGSLQDMILDDVKEGEEGQYIEMVSTTFPVCSKPKTEHIF